MLEKDCGSRPVHAVIWPFDLTGSGDPLGARLSLSLSAGVAAFDLKRGEHQGVNSRKTRAHRTPLPRRRTSALGGALCFPLAPGALCEGAHRVLSLRNVLA